MIVYFETNLVLELVFGQEQTQQIHEILELARHKVIELVFPVFALIEPSWRITEHNLEADRLKTSLSAELKKHQKWFHRSRTPQNLNDFYNSVSTEMAKITRREADLFEATTLDLLDLGRCLEINGPIYRQAVTAIKVLDLSLFEALIYASIIADLQQQDPDIPKCFMSKDGNAFANPDIKAELRKYNCVWTNDFNNGLKFIESKSQK